jgi:hypothetical protein
MSIIKNQIVVLTAEEKQAIKQNIQSIIVLIKNDITNS